MKPWNYRRPEFLNKQPYKRAFEINDANARKAGGCWSDTDVCDDTQCACADNSLAQAKRELATRP